MYINRFRTKHRPLDWPMVLIKLNHAGLSYDELGEIIGKASGSIRNMVSEAYPYPEEWDAAFALLDLYTMLHEEEGRIDFPKLTEIKPFKQRLRRVR
jgi:hypothetical protein